MPMLTTQKTKEYSIVKDDYTDQGLQKITEVGLLSEQNTQKISDISKNLAETWAHERIWRTETEMRYSVLNDNKHPTKGMKFLQARREQEVHFRELMYLSTEYQEKQGELIVLEAEYEELENDAELSEKMKKGKLMIKEAEIKKAQWALMEMQKAGHHRVREVTTWEKIKQELDDGSFDSTDYDAIQKDGLKLRWENQIEVGKKTNATPGHIGSIEGALKAMQIADDLLSEPNKE